METALSLSVLGPSWGMMVGAVGLPVNAEIWGRVRCRTREPSGFGFANRCSGHIKGLAVSICLCRIFGNRKISNQAEDSMEQPTQPTGQTLPCPKCKENMTWTGLPDCSGPIYVRFYKCPKCGIVKGICLKSERLAGGRPLLQQSAHRL